MNTQFGGIYRIQGHPLKVQMAAMQILQKEPLRSIAPNALDGTDLVMLTQRDAAELIRQELGIDTPIDMQDWTIDDWADPNNQARVEAYVQSVQAKEAALGGPQAFIQKVVDFFHSKKQAGGKDAYNQPIQEIQA